MTYPQASFLPPLASEVRDHLRCLLLSLVAEGKGPYEALNAIFLMGCPPEHLVEFARAIWTAGPERHLAFVVLANAALEPEPMLEALRRDGFSDLSARAALLACRPEWSRLLLADWPSKWPCVSAKSLEVAFSGASYRLPQGCLAGANFTLEGGPFSSALKVEHELTLKGLRRPSCLGPIETESLRLEGSTPLPRRLRPETLTLLNSNLRCLPTLRGLGMLKFDHSSILRLPKGLEAGVLTVQGCPRLRRLPYGWRSSLVLVRDCRRLNRILKPAAIPLVVALSNLPRLSSLAAGSVYGRLTLENCGLTHLPSRLKVQRDLVIRHCARFRALGPETEVGGDLVLEGLPTLKALPNDLLVHGTVRWKP